MKVKEIVQKKDKELQTDLAKLQDNLVKIRFEVAAKETNKHTEIKKIKKEVAQIKTILKEREIQREEEDEKKS